MTDCRFLKGRALLECPKGCVLVEGEHTAEDQHIARHFAGYTTEDEKALARLRMECRVADVLSTPELCYREVAWDFAFSKAVGKGQLTSSSAPVALYDAAILVDSAAREEHVERVSDCEEMLEATVERALVPFRARDIWTVS